MNISKVIEIINKELNTTIKTEFYTHVDIWQQWWKGHVDSFHKYYETTDIGTKKERKLYTMKMAKKICEDWASLLLNEKTMISIDDPTSNTFVLGEEKQKGVGGVLKDISFWIEANRLVEKAFYSGTGAFILKIDDLMANEDGTINVSADSKIRMEYLPATHIVPITTTYGKIIEVAFMSENLYKGKRYVYIEMHMKEDDKYVITNKYYENQNGALIQAPLPDDIIGRVETGSEIPFFSIIKPNMENHHRNNLGLGCAVFSEAIDNLMGVDIAFNNFVRDIRLGGKKVFYNRELTKTTGIDKDGKPIYIVPDDMLQQLFVSVGDDITQDKGLIHEFNPSLRVNDNRVSVQSHLDYLSFKCGLGTKYYSFEDKNKSSQMTATQYMGEKQELKTFASKHGIIIEEAIQEIIKAILWVGKNIMGLSVNPDSPITVEFPDGYLISDDDRRKQDLADIQAGLLHPYEYRMKWYNEDEETAKQMAEDLQSSQTSMFGGG